MKLSPYFALLSLFCALFVGVAHCLPWNDYHAPVSSTPTSKPIYSYFVEIDTIITRLTTWKPSDSSSDFPSAEKDLFSLGQAIDQATQALKLYKGTIETKDVVKIDATLKTSSKNVVSVTKNTKAAKNVFEKYQYTTLIVQSLQASANQFSVLFPLLESHSTSASFASLGYSISLIICSIGDTLEHLQSRTCTPEGLQFCKSLKGKKAGSIDTKPACQVVKQPETFSQCNQSSTIMFKYGYENSCIGKPQTQPWCTGSTGSGSGQGTINGGSSQSNSNVTSSGKHPHSEVQTGNGQSYESSNSSSSSFSASYEFDITVIFGYTPAQSQLYTVCNPPK